MIVVIEDMEGFKSLETEWNDLYSDNDFLPFQSYEYNFISWNDMLNNQQNSLFIICYYEENAKQIGAIFPLYVDIRKCLRFINDSHTDFQTALIRKNCVHLIQCSKRSLCTYIISLSSIAFFSIT